MNGLIERIDRLGPFGCINIELEKGSSELSELAEHIDLDSITIGDVDEYEINDAKVKVYRASDSEFHIDIVKHCTGILGKY